MGYLYGALIIIGFLSILFIPYYLSHWINTPFRKFFCRIGWHSVKYDNKHKAENDPLKFLTFAKCQWCNYEGQLDSQGNLF